MQIHYLQLHLRTSNPRTGFKSSLYGMIPTPFACSEQIQFLNQHRNPGQ